MMAAGLGAILLDVLALVEAGYELKRIVDTVREKEAAGATRQEISKYLGDLADMVLRELREAP